MSSYDLRVREPLAIAPGCGCRRPRRCRLHGGYSRHRLRLGNRRRATTMHAPSTVTKSAPRRPAPSSTSLGRRRRRCASRRSRPGSSPTPSIAELDRRPEDGVVARYIAIRSARSSLRGRAFADDAVRGAACGRSMRRLGPMRPAVRARSPFASVSRPSEALVRSGRDRRRATNRGRGSASRPRRDSSSRRSQARSCRTWMPCRGGCTRTTST